MAYTPTFSPYMAQPVDPYMGETEEERRKRLEAEAAAAEPAPVSPVKQTITYDPETGEQRMKIEGSVSDLSANNPFTPTVLTPGGDAMAEQPQPAPAPVMPEAPAPAPVAQEQRQLPPGVQMVDGRLQLAPVEIGEGVQLAGPMVPGAIPSKNTTGLNAPKLETGTGPTQIPSGMPAPAAEPVVTAQQLGSQQFPMTAAPAPAAAPTFEGRFAEMSSDVGKLAGFYNDPSLTKEQKQIVGVALRDQLTKQQGEEKGKQELAGMSENDIARLLKSKSEEGSWAKMLLLGFISPDLAGKEAAKLGLNDKWSVGSTAEGQNILFKTRDGIPIEGYDSTTGKKLGEKELISAVGSAPGKLKPDVSMQDVEKDGQAGRVVTTYDAQGRPKTQVESGGKMFAYDSSWKPRAISTAAAKVDYQLTSDLFKKHSGNVIDMLKDYETIRGPLSPEGRNEFFQKYGFGSTLPAANAAPATNVVGTGKGPVIPQANAAPVTNVQGTGGRVSGGVSSGTGGVGTPIGSLKANQEIGVAGAKENIQVQGARAQSFNKILDEEIRPQAQAGDTVSSVRKQQFAIFDRPGVDTAKLFGLYNAAAEGTGDQKASILRDIFGGVFKPEAEVSQRLAALNLTPQEKSALMEYNTANQKVNAATLKQNSGPGAISDAEQRANREANVDITKVPALGAFNAMAQSQFDGDRARYKADWATRQPAQNALELDKAWRKENQRLADVYRNIATERAKFIAANGGTTQAVQLGYKRFAVPEYDPATESWKKTKPLGQIIGGQ